MHEKSSCGVGFIVGRNGTSNHDIVEQGLGALKRVEHRGAVAADGLTGDGAGIMTDIPFELLGVKAGQVAVATLFISTGELEIRRQLLRLFEETFQIWGLKILKYREVPTNPSCLGELALKSLPQILHAIIERPQHCNTDASFDKTLHIAKQMTLTQQRKYFEHPPFFFTSLSANAIIYKALTTSEGLPEFYPDLKNSNFKSRFALFHRRFSTNTTSSWDKAQPFRLIAHNGEINTIAGNRSWGYSCEKSIGLPPSELISHDGISDSGSVNEMVEALMYRSSLPNIEDCLALMMPPSKSHENPNSFYKFWGRAMEPWDGPALMAFSNGETIGARLDRNGFRPCRWTLTKDHFYLASETGTFLIPTEKVLQKGALGAGKSVKISLKSGLVDFRDPSQISGESEFQFDPHLFPLNFSNPKDFTLDPVEPYLFGFTEEEQQKILRPMALDGKEPIGSMGDTARLAILSKEPRPFFDYFYQNFAQVTNPPLDYLREKMVTDLSVYLGGRPNLFSSKELIPPHPAFELPSPILSLGQLEELESVSLPSASQIQIRKFDITFNPNYGSVDLEARIEEISTNVVQAVTEGVSVVILSDNLANWDKLPIPALLILRACVRALNTAGLRLKVSIIMESGQIRTTHQMAATIAFGASAVCPRVALQLARLDQSPSLKLIEPEKKERNAINALESGLLKVMSKMGISVARSYQGSKLFTIIGLSQDLSRKYFRGVPSLIGGLEINDIAQDLIDQSKKSKTDFENRKKAHTYQLREHPQGLEGEKHSMTSTRARSIHKMVREKNLSLTSIELYNEFLKRGLDDEPINVRHLLQIRSSENDLPLENVEPAANILRRFGSGAMSFGAINAESQRDIILAMSEIGGRSNSGEGGENPYYDKEGITASTKQIASTRFGVTAQYLMASKEFQIKMAQGAKPGEGGQLMAAKVNEDIAHARHSMTNVDLISPPPMHDIYSIEDLKELIYELKQLKPDTKVGVKLVSGANIGTIAVGVVKAGADIVQISGSDGGTGAAPISSMKHAGLPLEFGLLEAHKALIENGLREKVILRTDGGLQTGKDIVMAALMGAQEFDFGKLLLVAEGCVMARICEKNTCPAGIATHDPKFKARYTGNKDQIVNLLKLIAHDVQRTLSKMNFSSIDEVIGRTDLLEVNEQHVDLIKKRKLDLSFALRPSLHFKLLRDELKTALVSELNEKIMNDTSLAIENNTDISLNYSISNTDRAVGAALSGSLAKAKHDRHLHQKNKTGTQKSAFEKQIKLSFNGSAGQGFGVFLVSGVELRLFGEANDSLCKGMSGGKTILRPQVNSPFNPSENVITGNCALYGATGGVLFVNGLAGDRFAVRNSGALAVVEGAGLHACEYMTNGTVIILGTTGENIGSGMTGGELFILGDQNKNINKEFLSETVLNQGDESRLFKILKDYTDQTSSPLGVEILENWNQKKEDFKKYLPKNMLVQKLKYP